MTPPDDFKKVVDYWNGEGERPSRESARRGLFELVENLKVARCRFNSDVAQALIPALTPSTMIRSWAEVLDQPVPWYGSAEAARIGRNVLLYQRNIGGWPQFFPLRPDYSRYITFNDGVMVRTLRLMRDAGGGALVFSFLDEESRVAPGAVSLTTCARRAR